PAAPDREPEDPAPGEEGCRGPHRPAPEIGVPGAAERTADRALPEVPGGNVAESRAADGGSAKDAGSSGGSRDPREGRRSPAPGGSRQAPPHHGSCRQGACKLSLTGAPRSPRARPSAALRGPVGCFRTPRPAEGCPTETTSLPPRRPRQTEGHPEEARIYS